MRALLREMFLAIPDVETLHFLIPEGMRPGKEILSLFQPISSGSNVFWHGRQVLTCNRHQFVPRLVVRQARVEDHDDLVPVFKKQSDMGADVQKGFFLASLIENQNEHNVALVAEVGTAFHLHLLLRSCHPISDSL